VSSIRAADHDGVVPATSRRDQQLLDDLDHG
jgi:hypothetical protein